MWQQPDERLSYPDVAIMVTDGESSDRDSAVYEAYLAREQGIDIIAIGQCVIQQKASVNSSQRDRQFIDQQHGFTCLPFWVFCSFVC